MKLLKGTNFRQYLRQGLAIASVFFLSLANTVSVYALPEVENIEHGQVNIEKPEANTMNITASNDAIINYSSFNINKSETVNIIQPNAEAKLLNRVVGSQASDIGGNLTANGVIFLINPNGINIRESAAVTAQGFVASTNNLSSQNFLNHTYVFDKELQNAVAIVNKGNIASLDGGYLVFISDAMTNSGTIKANIGTVAIVTGNKVTVSIDSKNLISVVVDEPTKAKLSGINEAISNLGEIQANSGKVLIDAQTVKGLYQNAVNTEGLIQATQVSVDKATGEVILGSNENIKVAGQIKADKVTIGDAQKAVPEKVTLSAEKLEAGSGGITVLAKQDIISEKDILSNAGDIWLFADYDQDNLGEFHQLGGTIKAKEYGNIYIDGAGEMTLGEISTDYGFIQIGAQVAPSTIRGSPLYIHTQGDFIINNKYDKNNTKVIQTQRGDVLRYNPAAGLKLQAASGKIEDLTATPLAANELKLTASRFLINSIADITHLVKNDSDPFSIQEVSQADSVITLKGNFGQVTYLNKNSLTLETNSDIELNGGFIIPANQLNLIAQHFGSVQNPLVLDAQSIQIKRINGDINILESLGIGSSIMLRGPPQGFGAIVYPQAANLSIIAQKGSILVEHNVVLYSSLQNINLETLDKSPIIIKGTLSAPEGFVRLWTCGTIDIREGQVISRAGGFLYNPEDEIVVSWTGGTGNWNTGGNWSGGNVPNTASYNVTIDQLNAAVTQDITAGVTIGYLTIGATNTASLSLSGNLTISNSDASVTNKGCLTVGANGTINANGKTISVNETLTMNGGLITSASSNLSVYAKVITMSSGSMTTTTSGYIILRSVASAGTFTLNTINSVSSVDIGSTSANTRPAAVILNGTVTAGNSTVYVYSDGDITQNANISSNSGSSQTRFYPDYDNSGGTITFTRSSGTVTASITYFLFPSSSTANFTLAGLNTSNSVYVGDAAATAPASVNVTNTVTTGGGFRIYSLGDITQNANFSVNSGNNPMYIYPDADNTGGTITYTRTSGTITASVTTVYFPTAAASTANFTLAGMDSTGNFAVGTSAKNDAPASINVTAAVASTAGTVTFYSYGGFTQNANISTASGSTTFYLDCDNSGGTITYTGTSGTVTSPTSSLVYFQSGASANFTFAGMSSTGAIYVGSSSSNAPASVNITAGLSTTTGSIRIYSNGDITQNANINAASGGNDAHIYLDTDNTGGTITYTRSSGTITAGTTYMYFPNGATANFTLTGINTSGNFYLGSASTDAAASVNVTGTLTSGGGLRICSKGDITQNANITANNGSSEARFYLDVDNSGGTVTYTRSSGTVSATTTYFYFPASSTANFTLAGIVTTAGLTVGTSAKTDAPASINITAAVTSNTGSVTFYSRGGATQNANISANSGSSEVAFYLDCDNSGGTITFTRSSGTITALGTAFYFQASATANFYLAGINTSGTLMVGNSAADAPATVTINNTTTCTLTMTVYSKGSISQAASSNTATNMSIILYPLSTVTVTENSTVTCDDYWIEGNLTINSNKTLNANGSDIVVSGAFENLGTLQLDGTEILTSLTKDTNSGTVEYIGTTNALNYGATYYNLTFNNGSGTWSPSGTLTVNNDLTVTAGTLDCATSDPTVNVTGNVTMDNTRTDMGDGTWTIGGSFDNVDVTTWNYNASTVVLTGTTKNLSGKNAAYFYNLTIQTGATITVPAASGTIYTHAAGLFSVNGSLTISSGESLYSYGDVSIGASGTLTGAGTMWAYAYTAGVAFSRAGGSTVSIDNFTYRYGNATGFLDGGTYNVANFSFIHNAGGSTYTLTLKNETYIFTGNLTFSIDVASGVYNINNITNNPNIEVRGNLTFVQSAGTLNWNKGTGTITLSGTANQTVNLLGRNVEKFIITKATSGAITWTSGDSITAGGAWSLGSQGLTVPAGVSMDLADGSYSHAVTGDVTLDCTAFDMGNSTLTVGGSFDFAHVTTWTRGTSSLIMTGTSKNITSKNVSGTHDPYNLTINAGADISVSTNSLEVQGTLAVNGILRIASPLTLYSWPETAAVTVGSAGSITGTGTLSFYRPGAGKGLTSFASGGDISVANLYFSRANAAAVLAPGTYASANVYIQNGGTDSCTWTPSAGTYTFNGNITFKNDNASSTVTISNTNNPNFIYKGNVTFTQSAGTLTYNKGGGTITLGDNPSDGTQSINFLGRSVEDIVVDGAGDTKLLAAAVTADSLTQTAGNLDLGDGSYTHSFGDVTISNGASDTFDMGNAVINVSGNFDWSGMSGTVTCGTSTLNMTGTDKTLKAPYNASPLRRLYALTIATGATITVPNSVGGYLSSGLLTINGAFTYNATGSIQCSGGITQGASGTMSGTGMLYINGGTITLANSSAIAPANIQIWRTMTLPAGTYSPTSLFLIISTTAGDSTFTWQAGTYTFTSPFQIQQYSEASGTLTISGTNNPTLIFQKDVTITQTTGTISFSPNSSNPNQLTGANAQVVNLGGKNLGTWVVNKPSSGAITWTSGDSITAGGAWSIGSQGLTVPAGVSMDLADSSYAHAVTGSVTLSASAFDMGNSTLTVGGSFNYASVTTWTKGSSTLVMTGTGVTLTADSSNSDRLLNNLTIQAGASVTATSTTTKLGVQTTATINGILSIASGKGFYVVGGACTVGANAQITGSGVLAFYDSNASQGLTSLNPTATINPAELRFYGSNAAAVLAPGVYATNVTISNDGTTSATWTPSAGTYTFTGDVEYVSSNASATTTITNSNNPNFVYQGDVTFTQSAGTLTYTKGTGTITLSGTAAQIINLAGRSVENIIVTKPSSGAITWTSGDTITAGGAWSIGSQGLTVPAGVTMDLADGGYTHAVTGSVTLDCAAFDMGNSILTVGGSFDYADVTTWTLGTSTLVMTGNGVTLNAKIGNSTGELYNLTIQTGAVVNFSSGATSGGTTHNVTINGTLSIGSAILYWSESSCTTVLGSSGVISGEGTFAFYQPGAGYGLTSLASGAVISVTNFRVYAPNAAAILAPGTYAAGDVYIGNNGATSGAWTPSAGTYTFSGNVTYYNNNASATLTITNSNNPSFVYQDDVTFIQSAGTLTYTKGSGTITLGDNPSDGTQSINFLDRTVEDIIVDASGDIKQLTDGVTTDALTVTAGTLNMNGQAFDFATSTAASVANGAKVQLTGTESLGANVQNLDINSGTVEYIGRNVAENLTIKDFGDTDYYNLTINDTNTNKATFKPGATLTLAGGLTVSSGTLDTNAQTVNVTGNFLKDGGVLAMVNSSADILDIAGNFTVSAGTVNLTAGTIYVGGNVAISGTGTFAPSSSNPNFYMDGNTDTTLTVGGSGNNLVFYTRIDKSTSNKVTLMSDVTGSCLLGIKGIFDVNGYTATFTYVYYGYSVGKIQMSSGTLNIGRNGYGGGSYSPWWVESGWTEDISGGTINVYGSEHATYGTAYFSNGSNFTPTGGTFKFVGTDTASIYVAETHAADFNFYNLTIGDGTNTKTVEINSSSQTVDVDGNLTISASATFSAAGKAIEVAGNWANSGTFTHGNNSVTFDATATGKTITNNDNAFYNLIFNGSGAEWTMQDNATIANDLTMTLGTLLGAYDITVQGGDVTGGSGAINLTGGKFTLLETGNFGGSTNWIFNDLTFGDGTNTKTTSKTGSNAVTITNQLKIQLYHTLQAGSGTWNLTWGQGTSKLTDISQISTGWCFSLALKSDGSRVYAWGSNAYGQLGNNSTTDSLTPVEVYGVGDTSGTHFLGEGGSYGGPISAVSAGVVHSMALKSDGTRVYAWGYGYYGNLGNNGSSSSYIPVQVYAVDDTGGTHFLGEGGVYGGPITAISAGYYFSMALAANIGDNTSRVYSWGYNPYGNLGINSTSIVRVPTRVYGVGITDASHFLGEGGSYGGPISAISAGMYYALALKSDGSRVYAWGYNPYGNLGINSTSIVRVPTRVYGVGITDASHFLGEGGSYGGPISAISAGMYYTSVALAANIGDNTSRVYTWGLNNDGQCGINSAASNQLIPVRVYGVGITDGSHFLGEGGTYGGPISRISAGVYHCLALKSDGTRVYAWGNGGYGQLGLNSISSYYTPKVVYGKGDTSGTHFLGEGGSYGGPISAISANYYFSLALATDNSRVYAWGYNQAGQLGNDSLLNANIPIEVSGLRNNSLSTASLTDISHISAGYYHTLALKSDGSRVYAWGYNAYGQLGNNSTTDSLTPVLVYGLGVTDGSHFLGEGGSYGGPISAISAGTHFSAALKSDGSRVYTWGYNGYGRLGNNSTTNSYIPVQVYNVGYTSGTVHYLGEGGAYGGPIDSIDVGYYNVLALDQNIGDGTSRVYAWGYNANGQLGINSTSPNYKAVPVTVYGVGDTSGTHFLGEGGSYGGPISQVSMGTYTAMALKSDGSRVYTWGHNAYGQCGINSSASSQLIPVRVFGVGDTSGTHFLGEGGSYGGPIDAISMGQYTALALDQDIGDGTSRVFAWGYNAYGQIGINSASSSVYQLIPIKVWGVGVTDGTHFLGEGGTYGGPISRISAGSYYHNLALKSDGSRVYAWGYNAYGQLGVYNSNNYYTPKVVYGKGDSSGTHFLGEGGTYGGPISQVSAGCLFSIALKSDNSRVYGWGYNGQYGCLGNKSMSTGTLPIESLFLTQTPLVVSGTLNTSTVTGSTFNFNGYYNLGTSPLTQVTIPTATYYDLTVNNSSGLYRLAGATGVSRNFTLTAGTLETNGNTLTVSGGAYTQNGGILQGTINNINVTVSAGNFTQNAGSIKTFTSGNITLNVSNILTLGTVTSAGNITIGNSTAPTAIHSTNSDLSGLAITMTANSSSGAIGGLGRPIYISSANSVVSSAVASHTHLKFGALSGSNTLTIDNFTDNGNNTGTLTLNGGTYTSTVTYNMTKNLSLTTNNGSIAYADPQGDYLKAYNLQLVLGGTGTGVGTSGAYFLGESNYFHITCDGDMFIRAKPISPATTATFSRVKTNGDVYLETYSGNLTICTVIARAVNIISAASILNDNDTITKVTATAASSFRANAGTVGTYANPLNLYIATGRTLTIYASTSDSGRSANLTDTNSLTLNDLLYGSGSAYYIYLNNQQKQP